MRNPFRTSPRTKAEMKREQANWTWGNWNRARRRKRMQRQVARSMQKSPWKSVAGGLVAGAASLLAYFALQSASERKRAGSGSFRFSSDPLTAPRYDRKRAFGWF